MNKITNAALVAMALMLTSCGSGTATDISSQDSDEVTWPSDIVSETGAISFPQGFLKWQTLGA
ncbi:MAG: hypothetical protein ABJN65_01265 [Parasphingorhabdus sp.]